MNTNFVRYTDSVEQIKPNEQEVFREIGALMHDIVTKVGARQRHIVRSVHAKSHGLLKAKLTVKEDLPLELRQGLFSEPGETYDAIMRFSTNPGDILSDHISSQRGLAIKFLGVAGEKTPNHQDQTTQDIVMQNAKAFAGKDAEAFLSNLKLLDAHANDSETAKQAVSTTARIAETALETVGLKSPLLRGFGHPATNPLGETYSTLVAHRYGDYFGKIELVPVSENLKELCGKFLPDVTRWDSLREEIQKFFADNEAVWEMRVQLCTDLEKMPVEDASAEWDEKASPFITVATLTAAPQESYSDARRVFVDEKMSFSPWHSLAVHRPLGNIMRSRLKVYDDIANYRRRAEGREIIEPQSIEELPD